MTKARTPPETTTPSDSADPLVRLQDLLGRASKGDESTLPILRRMMQEPGFVAVCGGDLARQAELSLIKALAGKDLAFKEGLLSKMGSLRSELAGPDPTPVERLLAERVAACWLQVYAADINYAQAKNYSFSQGDYCQRKMDRAHRRYLQAIKTLELVRKMAVPVLRVEMGRPAIRLAVCPPADGDQDAPSSRQKA